MVPGLKDRLLSLKSDRFGVVDVPGAGNVYIHSMSEVQRAHFESLAQDEANKKAVKRLLVIMSAREGESKESAKVFTGEDVAAMGAMDSAVVDKLATEAMKICGIGEVDLDDLLKKPESDSKTPTVG